MIQRGRRGIGAGELLALTGWLMGAPGWAQETRTAAQTPSVSAQDRAFLAGASRGNLAEIAAGSVVLAKKSDAGLQVLARMIVDDHTKAQSEVKQLAASVSVSLPTEPDAGHKAETAALSRLSGAALRSKFLAAQTRDHVAAIALFQKEIRLGSHAEIKAFAQKTLPALQRHSQMVQELKHGAAGHPMGTRKP